MMHQQQQALNQYYNQLNQLGRLGGLYGLGQANQALYNNSPGSAYSAQLRAYQGIAGAQGVASTPAPIPREGIRAGEITAYRAWALTMGNGWLKAVSADKIWIPGETMEGDVERHGIHCFKHPAYVDDAFGSGKYVGGTIEIWGEIIEHEKGYRAQFARIKSLNMIWGFKKATKGFWRKRVIDEGEEILEALRDRYCPLDGLDAIM